MFCQFGLANRRLVSSHDPPVILPRTVVVLASGFAIDNGSTAASVAPSTTFGLTSSTAEGGFKLGSRSGLVARSAITSAGAVTVVGVGAAVMLSTGTTSGRESAICGAFGSNEYGLNGLGCIASNMPW